MGAPAAPSSICSRKALAAAIAAARSSPPTYAATCSAVTTVATALSPTFMALARSPLLAEESTMRATQSVVCTAPTGMPKARATRGAPSARERPASRCSSSSVVVLNTLMVLPSVGMPACRAT